jgi:hypothetical protein
MPGGSDDERLELMPAGRDMFSPPEMNLQYALLDGKNDPGLPGQALISRGPNETPIWSDVGPVDDAVKGWETGAFDGDQAPPLPKNLPFNAILSKPDALGILAVIIVTTATGRAMLTVNAVRHPDPSKEVDQTIYSRQRHGSWPDVQAESLRVGDAIAIQLTCNEDVIHIRSRYQEI